MHLGDTGVFRSLKRLAPGLAGIAGDKQTAIATGRPQRALRGNPDHIGITRIDDNLRDVLGLLEAHVLPGGAAIQRAVHAIAIRNTALRIVLAAAQPDHQRIVRINRHAAE